MKSRATEAAEWMFDTFLRPVIATCWVSMGAGGLAVLGAILHWPLAWPALCVAAAGVAVVTALAGTTIALWLLGART